MKVMVLMHSYTLLSCTVARYNNRVDILVIMETCEFTMDTLGSEPRGTPHFDHTNMTDGSTPLGLVAMQVKFMKSYPGSCKP